MCSLLNLVRNYKVNSSSWETTENLGFLNIVSKLDCYHYEKRKKKSSGYLYHLLTN